MKRIATLILAAGLVFGAATGASAIDFKAKGQWLMGFGVSNDSPVHKFRAPGTNVKNKFNSTDTFGAQQRVRLQLDAVASEALSGTVQFEIGDQVWGRGGAVGRGSGGALGTDGVAVEVKHAYIDWIVPQTDLKFRMGLQALLLPNVAGGSAVLDDDAAAVVASYQFNENVGLTALWARPFNDNFAGNVRDPQNYLDNMDIFALMLPLTFDGFKVTPWAMYGMNGRNTAPRLAVGPSIHQYPDMINNRSRTGKGYGSMFWAGLPMAVTAFDPLNIELDLNYGYVENMGRFDAQRFNYPTRRANTGRQGWLAKALVEYKLDWGVPGIFAWYGSGDDGDIKNGSERMPSLSPCGNFTSYMGDGNMGWMRQDYIVSYAGTWGFGLQLRDMSFMEDLKHTFRVAYWGGTNSPNMPKYTTNSYAWTQDFGGVEGPYLTTNDGLVEFNLVNSYKIYENLEMNLELDYVINCMDNSTWKKAGGRNSSFEKQDMWNAKLVFAYSF